MGFGSIQSSQAKSGSVRPEQTTRAAHHWSIQTGRSPSESPPPFVFDRKTTFIALRRHLGSCRSNRARSGASATMAHNQENDAEYDDNQYDNNDPNDMDSEDEMGCM